VYNNNKCIIYINPKNLEIINEVISKIHIDTLMINNIVDLVNANINNTLSLYDLLKYIFRDLLLPKFK